ncbi:MAG: glycosyltransferase [Magnetococcales bacterium]|nr:glycosyltransferase [Magnetococcales bacterium]
MADDSRRNAPPPILAFAPHPWDNHWLSRQQLLTRLAQRGWPVLYSYGPLHWWKRGTPVWQKAALLGRVERREGGVLVDCPGRFPALWPRWPAWDRRVIALTVARLLRALPDPNAPRIAMLFHPMFEPYLEWLRPERTLYHVYDVYRLMDDWSPDKSVMEERLVARADLITASSPGMARALPGQGPQKARLLPNGADARRFAQVAASLPPCPADLANIPSPRIGYVGNINSKVDLEMIDRVAEHHPGWHWVFLGPVYMNGDREREVTARMRWERLQQRPNIHFLGLKSREETPVYVAHMTVNVICYKIAADDWVVHGYPTKLHEYLATGQPVVAAPQEAILAFGDVVTIAATHEEWEAALAKAIAGNGAGTPATRRERALANTWDSRVDLLEGWLMELTGRACR